MAASIHIADYDLITEIGHGAYGQVWLAREQLSGVYRAIKIILAFPPPSDPPASLSQDRTISEPQEERGGFIRDLEGVRTYQQRVKPHPNLIGVLHVGRSEAFIYYVMELGDDVRGPVAMDPAGYEPHTLAHEIQSCAVLPPRKALEHMVGILAGLSALHDADLVHRDVKPSNVVFKAGQPCLVDIGLVTIPHPAMTQVGTPGYIPPEGLRDRRCDIFAAGKVLYEMISGLPIRRFPELAMDHLDRPQRWHVSQANKIISRACHPDPTKRYCHAREMMADVMRCLKSLGSGPGKTRALRYAKILVPTVALTIVGALATAWVSRNRPQRSTPIEHPRAETIAKACRWICTQQDPRTQLFRSYDTPGDHIAWSHDQASAIRALAAADNIQAASRCADAMLGIRHPEHRVWVAAHNSATLAVEYHSISIGTNTCLGLALLDLYRHTRQEAYLSAARDIGEFALKHQVTTGQGEGAILGGLDEHGKQVVWTNVESNAASLAFLSALSKTACEIRYRDAAVKIAQWLDREMWDRQTSCYRVGYVDSAQLALSDFPELLTSQTWTILAYCATQELSDWPREARGLSHNGLPWLDRYRCTVRDNAKTLTGFAKVTLDKDALSSIWVMGTASYVLAARRAGGLNSLHAELEISLRSLQRADGSMPYSIGTFSAGADGRSSLTPTVYPGNWRFGSIEGTAWVVFMERDLNPFANNETSIAQH